MGGLIYGELIFFSNKKFRSLSAAPYLSLDIVHISPQAVKIKKELHIRVGGSEEESRGPRP